VKECDVTLYFNGAKNTRRYVSRSYFQSLTFRLVLFNDILIIGNRNNVNSNIKYFLIGQLLLTHLLIEDIPESSGMLVSLQFISSLSDY
jgi:hypothetical protein